MRPAYFPQSGYKHEPSALPNWGLVLQKKDETQSVRSELPTRRLEVPKWREWKGRLNRSLRMKSEVLEINLTGHLFLRRLPPCINILQIQKSTYFKLGQTTKGILVQEKLTDQSTRRSLLADGSSILQICLIRSQFMDVSPVTYFSDVNKSLQLRENEWPTLGAFNFHMSPFLVLSTCH